MEIGSYVPAHVYRCIPCDFVFAAEASEKVDHSDIVCPVCLFGEDITDAGSGYVMVTKEPEVMADAGQPDPAD